MMQSCLTPELYCTDLKRSLAFYVGALGFSIKYQRPEEGFAYLERQGATIMLEELGASREWITGDLQPPFGRGVNFEIATTDAAGLYASLQKAGFVFFLALEDKWYRKDDIYVGNRQFLIQDPDGYLLRFAEDLGDRTAEEMGKQSAV